MNGLQGMRTVTQDLCYISVSWEIQTQQSSLQLEFVHVLNNSPVASEGEARSKTSGTTPNRRS